MSLLSQSDRNTLLERWAEPTRIYHGPRHLQDCLTLFEGVRHLAADADAVEAALWLHDAVYVPQRDDNELESAHLARRMLGASGADAARIGHVVGLILATTHLSPVRERDAQLVCDIDLSILGAPDARFDEYEREVRAEYAWVPDPVFRARRAKILSRFLSRPHVFQTAHFGARLEWRARLNIARSLEALRGAVSED